MYTRYSDKLQLSVIYASKVVVSSNLNPIVIANEPEEREREKINNEE